MDAGELFNEEGGVKVGHAVVEFVAVNVEPTNAGSDTEVVAEGRVPLATKSRVRAKGA